METLQGKIFIVVDPNVVISAALGIGHSLLIFELNDKEEKFKFIAPQYFIVELGSKTEKIAKKTKFSLESAQDTLKAIIDQITFVSDNEFRDQLYEAREILKGHEKDVPYLALALEKDCNILSGDKVFKQLSDKVKTPREILEMFGES